MDKDAARQQRVQWGQSLPARRLRVNLMQAAAAGPVLTDMYIRSGPHPLSWILLAWGWMSVFALPIKTPCRSVK